MILICHKMRIFKPTSAAEASDSFRIKMELIVTAVERSLIRIAIYAMIAISISDPAKLDMACAIRLAKERNLGNSSSL